MSKLCKLCSYATRTGTLLSSFPQAMQSKLGVTHCEVVKPFKGNDFRAVGAADTAHSGVVLLRSIGFGCGLAPAPRCLWTLPDMSRAFLQEGGVATTSAPEPRYCTWNSCKVPWV
eukprot:TRINITY_DN2455_c0_g1_i3.p1 TRINITY_DN2455_c0_g1~~TRINITY_DN2455_c0_g1_i3.p1  ORF type:complete len:115 (-),score=4.06 TRINITY_DN2455_c0_g1_i3:1175-1519(-)